jgi:hypothetical protein
VINLLWLVAIVVALVFQSVPGLLAIIAVFEMERLIDVKAQLALAREQAEAAKPRCVRCAKTVNAPRTLLGLAWHPECLKAASDEVRRARDQENSAQELRRADSTVVARHAQETCH